MFEALNNLKKTAYAALERATALDEEYQKMAVELEKCINLRLKETLREHFMGEIDGITRPLLAEANRKHADYSHWQIIAPNFYSDVNSLLYREVWISAAPNKDIYFHVEELNKDSILVSGSTDWEKKQSSRYTPLEEFEERVKMVKSSILNGKLDWTLKMKAKEVLWEIMGYGGKLLPEEVRDEYLLKMNEKIDRLRRGW